MDDELWAKVKAIGSVVTTEGVGERVGDRTRWFMAHAWEEGVQAGHDCTGTSLKGSCNDSNPYRGGDTHPIVRQEWYYDRRNLAAVVRLMGERGDTVEDVADMLERPERFADDWRVVQATLEWQGDSS